MAFGDCNYMTGSQAEGFLRLLQTEWNYILVNATTFKQVSRKVVRLSEKEAETKNYAFALNGANKKYILR